MMDPNVKVIVDTLWVMITAFLVFFMNLGFAAVESGICPGQEHGEHHVEELHRVRGLVAGLSGARLGPDVRRRQRVPRARGPVLAQRRGQLARPPATPTRGPIRRSPGRACRSGPSSSSSWCSAGPPRRSSPGRWPSGSSTSSFIVFSFVMAMFIYPVVGHWVWGGGWLAKLGMFDFAGSTVVHSVGGWAALAGVLILGPRIGKFDNGDDQGHPGPQPAAGDGRHVRAVVRMVRVQPGLDHGGRPRRDQPRGGDDQHGGRGGDHERDADVLAPDGQAGPGHDAQRLPGRPGGDHRAVRLRRRGQLDRHRPDRRRAGGGGGDDVRPAADRRSGRRAVRTPGQRRVRDHCGRPVRPGRAHRHGHRQRPVLRRRLQAARGPAGGRGVRGGLRLRRQPW